jgi:hypothetical protein
MIKRQLMISKHIFAAVKAVTSEAIEESKSLFSSGSREIQELRPC